ncbi:TPA: DUF551 domain-containing protein [Klebsiella quasipneumoniae]|nr:DUF551 domain-containing protein [Klebsiella quasipneumoniae]
MKFEEWLSQQDGVIEVDCGCVATEAFYHWMRVAYEAGNSPAIPDGYVLVPKEPTSEMVKKMRYHVGSYDRNIKDGYKAMLTASPQSPGSEPATVPGKWIPVSERMPIEFEAVIAFDGDQVYGEAMYSSDDGFTIDGYEPCDRLNLQNVTHWMPLPAAPQEVKGE